MFGRYHKLCILCYLLGTFFRYKPIITLILTRMNMNLYTYRPDTALLTPIAGIKILRP